MLATQCAAFFGHLIARTNGLRFRNTQFDAARMPIFDPPILTRLLGSIQANNLVVLCGAGLSIPEPSNLLSAVRVSRACYDKWLPTQQLPANMRDDIDALAGHFYAAGMFKS